MDLYVFHLSVSPLRCRLVGLCWQGPVASLGQAIPTQVHPSLHFHLLHFSSVFLPQANRPVVARLSNWKNVSDGVASPGPRLRLRQLLLRTPAHASVGQDLTYKRAAARPCLTRSTRADPAENLHITTCSSADNIAALLLHGFRGGTDKPRASSYAIVQN